MLKINNLSKKFDQQIILSDINFELAKGDIGVLLGPSGSGKTTMLRIIAGLETADSGQLRINGALISSQLPPGERQIAFLFQNFALFPHLNVVDNIAIALRKMDKANKDKRIDEVLELCGLPEFRLRFPHELSGGQQQRLALARALAPRPQLLLMDEPFSGLDPELRAKLGSEVRELLKEQDMTALVVTHQIEEAYDMADQIALLHAGKIVQSSPPYEVYHHPRTPFIAKYFDHASFVSVEVSPQGHVLLDQLKLGNIKNYNAGKYQLLLRPDDIIHDDDSALKAKIIRTFFRGAYFLYELELESIGRFYVSIPSHHNHAKDDFIGIRFEVEHLLLFNCQVGI